MVSSNDVDWPSVIYKYRDWQKEKHRRMITDQEVYLASPADFNDPYDCAINVSLIKSLKDADYVNRSIDYYYADKTEEEKLKIKKTIFNDSYFMSEKWEENLQKRFIQDNHSRFGVLTLTEHPDNILMWSHYSNNHKGFVVGLDSTLILNNLQLGNKRKVTYISELPEILLSKLFEFEFETVFNMLYTKYQKWDYEDEYRCVKAVKDLEGKNLNRIVKLPKEYFKEIILGALMPFEVERDIFNQILIHLPHVKIFRAKKDKKEFKINIVPAKDG